MAKKQGIRASKPFREMMQVYEDYREEKEFRWLQRYGALRSQDRFGSEDEIFDFLYRDR